MKCWHAILINCPLILLLTAVNHLSAADKSETKASANKIVAEPNIAAAWQRRIPDLISDNLPLEAIIKELRQQFPEINFLIKQQSDTDVDVSSISVRMVLRAVTLEEILKALELAAAMPIQITGGPDGRLVVFERKPSPVRILPNGFPDTSDVIETRVFSIARYLDDLPDEKAALALKELDDVLRTAGRMQTDANKGARVFDPKLHIHRSTKLLIAVGRSDELYVIEQVAKELQGASPTSRVGEIRARIEKRPSGEPPAGNKP